MLPYLLLQSPYGPVITATAASQLPDFYAKGRARFFLSDPWLFWLSGERSGIFPTFKPLLLGSSVALPLLLRLPQRFLLAQSVISIGLLLRIAITAFVLFAAAHALLFRLHLPSRYTAYTLRFALVFAAALTLTLLLEAGLRWLQQPTKFWWLVLAGGITLMAGVLLYPIYAASFPDPGYKTGKANRLYEFLAQQPKQTLVASLLREADNLPTFAQRSVLVAPEFAIPYHVGYANQFRRRAEALIEAQYTPDREVLRQFIQTYGIDYWLIDQTSFAAGSLKNQWIRQYPDSLDKAVANLKQHSSIVEQRSEPCTVLQAQNWRLLQAACLVQ
jgi:hypothetical protein